MTTRYAICNETFEGWDHRRVCRFVAETGYQGLEIAPFTIAPTPHAVSTEQRRTLRRQAEECGLTLLGLHWLLARTEGLMLTSPDSAVRQRTADYLVDLARLCHDLGGTLMVLGSPAQRRIPAGATLGEATNHASQTLELALPGVAAQGVSICLEPLSLPEADFITTCAEAVALIDRIGHPNLTLHLDVKAMASEEFSTPDLITRYANHTGHFHANDANRRGPGFGPVDFVPILRALKQSKYNGWVSVEVFDYSPDPETIARESLRYLRECAASV